MRTAGTPRMLAINSLPAVRTGDTAQRSANKDVINARAGAALAAEADAVCDRNQLQSNFRKALRESQLAVEWADEVGIQVAGQDQVFTAVWRERIKEPVRSRVRLYQRELLAARSPQPATRSLRLTRSVE